MQTKHLQFDFEIKSFEEATGAFAGYASVFHVVDSQRDVMQPGAFARTLKGQLSPSATRLLWQHQMDEPIGVIHTLKEDAYGLYVAGQILLDLQRGREAYALLKAGAINGLSIGYKPSDYAYDADGVRHLKDVELWEVSLVTFPANDKAGITHLKADPPQTIRELEQILRDAGFSRKDAKAIAAGGFPAHKHLSRDAGDEEALITALEQAVSTLAEF